MNIENEHELTEYLRHSGRIGPDQSVAMRILSGGVSNRTVWVQPPTGPAWVIKQALPKLRVQVDWYSSPDRSAMEALGMRWLTILAPARTVPSLLFEDRQVHLLAMEAVPDPHSNWKHDLMVGNIDSDHISQFGHLLGGIHKNSAAHLERLRVDFDDRQYFESLRLEPYYKYTSQVVPPAATFLRDLIEQTWATRQTLVHGDYSPKNVLVHRGRLMLIDHEVVHFGDPAFDLGFSMAHLLSKAHHLVQLRSQFCEAATAYWKAYSQEVGNTLDMPAIESRFLRHTIACLLARSRGRSPLEYLDAAARDRQQHHALQLLHALPTTLDDLVHQWREACDSDSS